MPRNPNAAVIAVRMSPQLRDGLREAAVGAGCSLNAYCVQVLAAAAGQRARFRGSGETGAIASEARDELRGLDRDGRGYPVSWQQRDRHVGARRQFLDRLMGDGVDTGVIRRLLVFVDAECPWHYVAWSDNDGPLWPPGWSAAGQIDAA